MRKNYIVMKYKKQYTYITESVPGAVRISGCHRTAGEPFGGTSTVVTGARVMLRQRQALKHINNTCQ